MRKRVRNLPASLGRSGAAPSAWKGRRAAAMVKGGRTRGAPMSQRRGDAEGGERRDLLGQRKRRAQRPREPSAEASIVVGVGDLGISLLVVWAEPGFSGPVLLFGVNWFGV